MLEVEDPGLLLTLQDRGRPGLAHLGVPPSGACDPWGLAVANLLAGAPPDGVAIELTLGGAELRVVEACVVSLAGADLGAERDDGRPLPAGVGHRLPPGARIRFTGSSTGMRAYLGLAGGIAADRILGSASTTLQGGRGGLGGRPLAAGDRLLPIRRGDLDAAGRAWPSHAAPHPADQSGPVGFIPGPDLRHLAPDVLAAIEAAAWTVGRASDRMGLRLDGPSLPPGREILSHPVLPGAIQVPGDGRPIVLMVDGPTIGGYPVAGVVARAELPRLGQLRPGDPLRLSPQDPVKARAAWRAQQHLLAAIAAALHADALRLRLQDGAGA